MSRPEELLNVKQGTISHQPRARPQRNKLRRRDSFADTTGLAHERNRGYDQADDKKRDFLLPRLPLGNEVVDEQQHDRKRDGRGLGQRGRHKEPEAYSVVNSFMAVQPAEVTDQPEKVEEHE